ncbi:MAG TPA: glucose-6-phosphate dehydrogenase assembly protein OpcA [Vicinamibacterales bacterium]|nr:glucose-6-phosphate dehydrogenase assembly protein OpcA [Vicinamibacterales bacterium]
MASDVTAAIDRIAERPMPVDPPAIEAEFLAIWRDASGSGYDQSSIRLRVLNFVAVGYRQEDAQRFDGTMQVLPARHPCRGILALGAGEAERLEASISARCWRLPTGARHMCSEEVRLTGRRDRAQELASALLGLLVPELPVTVWLMDEPDVDGWVAMDLLDVADRVFFDSAAEQDLASTYQRLLRAARQFELELSDLAWGRLSPWRELIAQCFDGDRIGQLDKITAIEVDFAREHLPSEALLLAGWLVSRLGLSLADLDVSSGERIRATLYARTRGVTVTLTPAGSAAPCAISELRIRTADVTISVAMHAANSHMHVREQWDGEPVHRTVASAPEDDASVITRMLDEFADPAIYADAVGSALALLGT